MSNQEEVQEEVLLLNTEINWVLKETYPVTKIFAKISLSLKINLVKEDSENLPF